MFAKKFSKQENLPILKPSSYTLRHKDRILSLGGSPSKTEASLMDINEAEKSVHVGGHTMNVFNFSSMQLRKIRNKPISMNIRLNIISQSATRQENYYIFEPRAFSA